MRYIGRIKLGDMSLGSLRLRLIHAHAYWVEFWACPSSYFAPPVSMAVGGGLLFQVVPIGTVGVR